jgi:hypothetical protein
MKKKVFIFCLALLALSTASHGQKRQKQESKQSFTQYVAIGEKNIYSPYTPDVTSIRKHQCPDRLINLAEYAGMPGFLKLHYNIKID